MKKLLIALFFLLYTLGTCCYAQEKRIIDNDSLLEVFFKQNVYAEDTGAHAVILSERAEATFGTWMIRSIYVTLSYNIERCIKINSQQALELADISIPYSKNLKVKNIEFMTANMEEGHIVKQKMRKPDMIKEKLSQNAKLYKLSLPNVKPGTIIYYTYTYEFELAIPNNSPYFPLEWRFQNDYPTLESKFTVTIPEDLRYKVVAKNVSFDTVRTRSAFNASEHGSYANANFSYDKIKSVTLSWVRRNVARIPDLEYFEHPESKKEKLTVYTVPYLLNSAMPEPENTWEGANGKYYYNHPYLGGWVFHPDDTLSIVLDKIASGHTSNLSMAKAIYAFVRDSIECTGFSELNRVWSSRWPRNTLAQKKGTVADKNILLCALLRKAGMKSYPILICTADEDKLDERYFEPDALNYMVSLVILDDKYYYMDPSPRYLPFGILKPRCYNDFAWIVSEKGAGILLKPDSLTERSVTTVSIKPGAPAGHYNMIIEHRLGNISGPAMRALMREDSAAVKKQLERKISQMTHNTRLRKYTLLNKDNPDTSLIISYDLDLQLDTAGNIAYLNPFFQKLFEHNPFIAADRKYPVEFGTPFLNQYFLKFQLDKDYTVEDYHSPVSLNFQNGNITYKQNAFYDEGNHILTLSGALSSRVPAVAADQYNELRAFYDRIITEQNKKLIIRKAGL